MHLQIPPPHNAPAIPPDATLTPDRRAQYSREAMLEISRRERLRAAQEVRAHNVAAWKARRESARITGSFIACGVGAVLATALMLSAVAWAQSDALWLAGVACLTVSALGFIALCLLDRRGLATAAKQKDAE